MSTVDNIFSPAGFVFALELGVEPTVEIGASNLSGVTVSKTDLRCARCDRPIDVPKRKRARFVAVNKVLREGRCLRCPEVGPPLPPVGDS